MQKLRAELREILETVHPRKVTQTVNKSACVKLLDSLYSGIPRREQIYLFSQDMPGRPSCPVCDAPVVLRTKKYGTTCSRKCSASYQNTTGAKQRSIIKSKKTAMARYGADSYSQTSEFRNKFKKTMLERYGVEHALQNPDTLQRKEDTDVLRHGGVPLHNTSIRKKHAEALHKRSTQIIKQYFALCNEIHENFYTYRSVPRQAQDKVDIECPIHGTFHQSLIIHARGHGCPSCANVQNGMNSRTPPNKFFEQCSVVHDSKYTYPDLSTYKTAKSMIHIVCPTHGIFWQRACDHLHGGHACPRCGNIESAGEREIKEFIEELGIAVDHRRRDLIAPYEIDIYVPEFNIGIEYCGLMWHSEKYKKSKTYHLMKHELCEKIGIRLITIFEDEWKHNRDKVVASIRHFMHKSDRGEAGRKCSITDIPWKQAKEFLNEYHLLDAGTSGKHRVGAFDRNGALVGVMVFGIPSDERGTTDVMELKRFVTDGDNHPGLMSRMLKWSMIRYEFNRVTAFVDRRWFSGDSKLQSGFKVVGTSPPSLWWTDFRRRYHRRHFSKSSLGGSDTKSKRELLEDMGIHRIWDCGKLKLEKVV
jgi:hypothetical protein